LVKILVECNQAIPEFLADRVPEDNKVEWDDDTDDETETNDPGAADARVDRGVTDDDAWVTDDKAAPAPTAVDDAWATGDADNGADAGDAAW